MISTLGWLLDDANPPPEGEGDREAVEGSIHGRRRLGTLPLRQPAAATSPSGGGLASDRLDRRLPLMTKRTIGWLLDDADRAALLRRFPPIWPDVIAHHVTLQSHTDAPLPTATAGEIVGHVDDGAGLQALVVAIRGTTDRPDGSTYHITWSLDRAAGRRAVESNDVLRERRFARLDTPIPIRLIPSELP